MKYIVHAEKNKGRMFEIGRAIAALNNGWAYNIQMSHENGVWEFYVVTPITGNERHHLENIVRSLINLLDMD